MNSPTIPSAISALRIPHEVAALIAALQLREPDTEALRKLTDQQWASLLTFCDLSHLTLPLAQITTDDFPSWVLERLEKNVADNAQRFERVKATYTEAARALDAAGVEHIVIKGFTQAPDYIVDPRLRIQSDIDLYCPAEMIEPARVALEAIGYKPTQELDYSRADHTPTLIRLGDWTWKGNSFDPEMPLSIELHFCLWNKVVSLLSITGTDGFWQRRTNRTVDDLSFPSLEPVDQLGYFALHILRNILSRDWVVHHVRELALFLHSHSKDDLFWNTWNETHDPALRALEAIAFHHARAWFGCNLHQQAEDAIANLTDIQKRWLDCFAGSALEIMFRENKDSVWLHLTLLNSRSAKLALLKRSFLPARISSISSPAVRLKNRQPRDLNGAHPYRRYVAFLASRCAAYSYLSFVTILRGIGWRFSSLQLAKQFWVFLAASFFLTWACLSTSFYSTCS